MKVFISYRRDGGLGMAGHIARILRENNISYFQDNVSLEIAQPFDEQIENGIRSSEYFLLILSKGALDRCQDENDWLYKEIYCAIDAGLKIIPICEPNFEWPKNLSKDIEDVSRWQELKYNLKYEKSFETELCNKLMGIEETKEKPSPNVESNKFTLKEKIQLSFVVSAIPLAIMLLFMIGRWVAWKEIGADPDEYLISTVAKKMKPIIVDGKVYYTIYDSAATLKFDISQSKITIEDIKTSSFVKGMVNPNVAILGTAFIAQAGIWNYCSNIFKKLKLKGKGKEYVIGSAVVVTVGLSYYTGKYTVYKRIKNPFNPECIDLLNMPENQLRLKRHLFNNLFILDNSVLSLEMPLQSMIKNNLIKNNEMKQLIIENDNIIKNITYNKDKDEYNPTNHDFLVVLHKIFLLSVLRSNYYFSFNENINLRNDTFLRYSLLWLYFYHIDFPYSYVSENVLVDGSPNIEICMNTKQENKCEDLWGVAKHKQEKSSNGQINTYYYDINGNAKDCLLSVSSIKQESQANKHDKIHLGDILLQYSNCNFLNVKSQEIYSTFESIKESNSKTSKKLLFYSINENNIYEIKFKKGEIGIGFNVCPIICPEQKNFLINKLRLYK